MNNYDAILDTAKNLIAPGQRCTLSSIITESVKEVLTNKYGENWQKKDQLFLDCYESLKKDFSISNYKNDIPYFYTLYYLFLNIPKIQLVLLQLLKRKQLKSDLKILDLGCGIGTTLFAILDLVALLDNLSDIFGSEEIFKTINLSFVDGSSDNLKVLEENKNYFKPKMKGFLNLDKFILNDPINIDITKSWINKNEKFDLIILSNILNELNFNAGKELLGKAEKSLSENGHIIVIDPADQRSSININKLKYEISKETTLVPVLPCGAYEKCSSCWNFRSTNLVYNDCIKYFDKIYTEKYGTENYKSFYNERLKWSYFVLSNSKNTGNETVFKLDDIKDDNINEVCFNVVGRFKNEKYKDNAYKICDGQSKKDYRFIIKDSYFHNISFGDLITINNPKIFRGDSGNYIFSDENSEIINIYEKKETSKLKFKNVKESSVLFILKRLWGFDNFREGQFPIIKRVLENIETLGILPTGAGKSVCYQLPAILKRGSSLVISPLKSLIKDQVDSLHKIGFEFVDFIDSSKTTIEKREILDRFKKGFLKILYIAPERLQIKEFQQELISTLSSFDIDYFIIDEAHCASEWGHDFRPSYLRLRDISNKLNYPTLIAVTATASPRVRDDILKIFSLKEENIVLSKSLDRPELSLEVKKTEGRENKIKVLEDILKEGIPKVLQADSLKEINENNSGIIFAIYANPRGTNTKQFGTEFIRDSIAGFGLGLEDSKVYYADMDDELKIATQEKFKENKFPLLVATKGFGMGIDKPNIDYIIHMCFSNSLEAYYQEAGRAGRDGEHAHSVIIANTREKRCIEDSNYKDFEPNCINSWTCHYRRGSTKCDYGAQAKFISDQYINEALMIDEIVNFLKFLSTRSKNLKNFNISIDKEDSRNKRFQSYLFYLQKENIIKDYSVEKYNYDGMEFSIELEKNLNEIYFLGIAKKINGVMQPFKKQRYGMLNSIWEYINNEEKCRKIFLMDYFGEEVSYKDGCNFCDIEGISGEKASASKLSTRSIDLFNNLKKLLEKHEFNYKEAKEILVLAYKDKLQESVKVRSMRFLEDYPDNIAANYFTGIITLSRNENDQYGKNQIYNAIKLLNESNDFDSIRDITFEVLEIDELFGIDIFNEFKFGIENIDFIEEFFEKLKNEKSKEAFYTIYFSNKLERFKNLLTIRRR